MAPSALDRRSASTRVTTSDGEYLPDTLYKNESIC